MVYNERLRDVRFSVYVFLSHTGFGGPGNSVVVEHVGCLLILFSFLSGSSLMFLLLKAEGLFYIWCFSVLCCSKGVGAYLVTPPQSVSS